MFIEIVDLLAQALTTVAIVLVAYKAIKLEDRIKELELNQTWYKPLYNNLEE